MHAAIQNVEVEPRTPRTREEAAQLLEELRAAYQALSEADRRSVKCLIARIAGTSCTSELD
jgi:hypothetical protein